MSMQAHSDVGTIASLLPYLMRNSGNPLPKLLLTAQEPTILDKSYPFCVLSDSGPAARLLEATFVTDAGSVLKKVFLLLQKDRDDFQEDELWPVTNPDIDSIWQQAFSFHERERNSGSGTVVFSAQLDGNGDLNHLAPLFFCRKRESYFHPPCPVCGLPLQLCTDDDLLRASGLQPYSGSLKRYLHCAPCSTQGIGGFYVNELNHDDPPGLMDSGALISEFGSLNQSKDPVAPFPCIRCPERDACYGPGGAVGSRIVPFSFYPFYLLVFDALSLNALEFLPLISGATFNELESRLSARNESGRHNCLKGIRREGLSGASFYPPTNERYFPEVLYLKLTFLDDVLRQFLAQPDILGHPDMRPTIDRVWVEFPNQSGLLPSFWNFRTRVIDIVSPPDTTERPLKRPSSNLLFYLGLLWFYSLLVNKKQSNKDVLHVLKDGLSSKERISAEILSGQCSNLILAPENIFWNPDNMNVGCKWYPLWKKSLDLGLSLLQSAADHDSQWSQGVFFDGLEELRTDVKNALFMETPVAAPQEFLWDEQRAGDDDICKILNGIIGKWRGRLDTGTEPDIAEINIESMETVILAPPKGAPASPASQPEEFTETVILSSRPLHSESLIASQQNETDDAVPETVIISPEMYFDDLAETIITPGRGQADPIERQVTSVEDDPATTVILAPQRTRERRKGW
jgi:hypothetical protein